MRFVSISKTSAEFITSARVSDTSGAKPVLFSVQQDYQC